jgi:hypothetical protein
MSAGLRLTRLHATAAALDLLALALVLVQAWSLLPPEHADRRVLTWLPAAIPVAFVVFLMVPRRAGVLAETEVPRRSLMAWATLGMPVAVGLLTLLLVALSGSFDSFTGFALVLAADAGRNACEWLRQRR